jgi:hypothetical protein
MASNILGKILVQLGLDSAAFESGASKASKLAQKSAKDISDAFEGAGSKIGSLFEAFGEAGGPLAGAFTGLGSTVQGVMGSLGPLAGALGGAGLAAAGVTAVVGAAALALVGIAVSAAKGAAELYDLSMKTGVSVETLSRLSFAAKESGVSQEQLAKGLEKLGKSAFAAATATSTTVTPFQRLGISVKDANNQIKDSETLLTELADKFSKMPDGPTKTALAMQIFSKSGADMIPLLDRGSAGIAKLNQQADILGVTITGQTAKSAKEFEEQLDLVGEAMTGIGNVVLRDLLPVMTSFMTWVDNALLNQNSSWRQLGSYFMDVMVPVIKILANAIEVVVTLVGNLLDLLMLQSREMFTAFSGLGRVIYDALTGNFQAAEADAAKALSNMVTMAADSGKRIADSWKSTYNTVKSTWFPTESKPEGKPHGGGDVDTEASNTKKAIAAINELIAKLKAQADAEGQLAIAQRESRAETLYATASQEALKQVEQAEAQAKKEGIGLTKQQKTSLTDAAMALSLYKAVAADQTAINNEIIKTQQETANLKDLSEAYSSGSQMAVYLAEKHQALSGAQQKVSDLQGLINIAMANGFGKTTDGAIAIARLNAALAEEQDHLKNLAAAYDASQQTKFAEELSKETNSVQQNIEALQGKIAATQLGAEALREYAVQQQLNNYLQTHQGMNAASPEYEAYKQALEQQSQEEQRLADISSVDAQVKIKNIQEEIIRLETLRREYESLGEDTTAIDAKIHEDQQQMIKDQTQLLTATNSWTNGFKAGMLNIQNQAQTTAQIINDSMTKLSTGIVNQFALMAEGSKTSWKSMLNAISMEIEKFIMSSLIQKFIGMLGGLLFPGANMGGNLPLAPAGSGGANLSMPGLASGGDVTPGSTYLVGENGPELFTSSTAGSIIPNGKIGGSTNNVNYVIDARGADAGAEQRIRMALRDVEQRSVMRAVATVQDMHKRGMN